MRIVFRHLSGSKANQVEEFSLDHVQEIVIGREPTSTVRFDPDRDDLVSRQHAKIVPDPANPGQFLITDLGSRNGTMVNRQKVYGTSRVVHGDTVQLGPGGPEFRIDVEPPPGGARPTRLATESADYAAPRQVPPTREGVFGSGIPPTAEASPGAPRPVGRATVERMVGMVLKQVKGESRKSVVISAATLAAVVVLMGGAYYFTRIKVPVQSVADAAAAAPAVVVRSQPARVASPAGTAARTTEPAAAQPAAPATSAPAAAAPAAGGTTGQPASPVTTAAAATTGLRDESFKEWLERSYQGLKGAPSAPATGGAAPSNVTSSTTPAGSSIPSRSPAKSPTAIGQEYTDAVAFLEIGWKLIDTSSGRQVHHRHFLTEGAKNLRGYGSKISIFVESGGQVEPALIDIDENGLHQPIGGTHTGSGFTVSSDGFLLTNRHVAASWHTSYQWPRDLAPAVLIMSDGGVRMLSPGELPRNWVPANSKNLTKSVSYNQKQNKFVRPDLVGKNFEGRYDYCDVTFAKTKMRVPGRLAATSDRHDVAMLKLDVPQPLLKVEPFDNYESIKIGDPVVVMGYPAVSPDVIGVTRSQDIFNRDSRGRVIPDPTLSVGNIAKVLRDEGAGRTDPVISEFGDVFQLTINSTGAGNSGGPLFDENGRVVGIFTSSRTLDARVTFAVPIRYGLELMRRTKVIR